MLCTTYFLESLLYTMGCLQSRLNGVGVEKNYLCNARHLCPLLYQLELL